MKLSPIERAIELKGTETKLAEAAGVSQPAINQAKKAGRMSADMAVRIEKATNGGVPRWESRPDLWEAPQ